jgi:hypothetical protein
VTICWYAGRARFDALAFSKNRSYDEERDHGQQGQEEGIQGQEAAAEALAGLRGWPAGSGWRSGLGWLSATRFWNAENALNYGLTGRGRCRLPRDPFMICDNPQA